MKILILALLMFTCSAQAYDQYFCFTPDSKVMLEVVGTDECPVGWMLYGKMLASPFPVLIR